MKMKNLNININTLVIILLVLLKNIQQVSSESYSGIGSVPSQFTWYICSKFNTNYTEYDMQQVSSGLTASPNFGTVVDGHHPQSYNQLGLLTYLTDYTGLQLYIDPTSNSSVYWKDGSCFDSPQLRCTKKMTYDDFKGENIICLAITNSQSQEAKFSLSISFTSGEEMPPITSIATPSSTTSENPESSTSTSKSSRATVTATSPPPFYASGINNNYSNNYNIWWVSILVGLASTIFTFLLL
ncbi:hypothetical protein Glove_508g10 [Diversispora epigaea]|uniref:Uncharacterized protein n=1 Tax=Diversispora epigaea TaxID=1348612 RepID=A0A397GHN1_9GLOM|nr:hypothetical protein Glove_508g10 [Diversispora epigaea]